MTKTADINVRADKRFVAMPQDMRYPRYSAETEAAIREARDIMSGRVEAKGYGSARALFDELDAEIDNE